jgi:hypothetical protein
MYRPDKGSVLEEPTIWWVFFISELLKAEMGTPISRTTAKSGTKKVSVGD